MNAKLCKRLRKEAKKNTSIDRQYDFIGQNYRIENKIDSERGLYRHLKDIAKEIQHGTTNKIQKGNVSRAD